jgi:hypothetical protein
MATLSPVGSSLPRSLTGLLQAQPAPPPSKTGAADPVVAAKIENIRARIANSPESAAATEYAISEVMKDPSLTKAQKEDVIASLIEMAAGKPTPYGGANKQEKAAIVKAFANIGTASTNYSTPELRATVTKVIGEATNAKRLDANDLHGLFSPAGNYQGIGVRELLTGIKDGKVLGSLAEMLAKEAGPPRNNKDDYKEQRVQLLVAAADIAGMAAKNGSPAMANTIIGIIAPTDKNGKAVIDVKLVDAMLSAGTQSGLYGIAIPGRSGLDALSSLLPAATNGPAADQLFATLVRADGPGSIKSPAGDPSAALGNIGKYFDRNASRLIESDWRQTNTRAVYEDLTRDFIQNIVYNKEYDGAKNTATVLATEMKRLSGNIQNTSLSDGERLRAGNSLGVICGSLKGATERFIGNEGDKAKDKMGVVKFFGDILFGELASKAASKTGPAGVVVGPVVGLTGDAIIDAMISGYVDRAERKAASSAEQLTGDLTSMGADARQAFNIFSNDLAFMTQLMSQFDQRFDKAES